ncbi:MAG: tRNA-specific 2-thiouridylase [Candidatus Pacebacteria bacterium]|nr:tRNA-specific 2-thiouridylase [Candidatus Paceibacterota bacterium]
MSIPKPKKAIIALSGGVDSSVAAILLKNQGYQVEGVFMRLGIAGDNQAEKNAGAIAEKLDIKFRVINLSKEFKEKIISYFISEYEKGRTPNPCVRCNKEIKFGILLNKVLRDKDSFIATGHYVNVIARSLSERSERNGDEAIPQLSSPCIVTGLLRHSVSLSLNSIPRNDSVEYKLLKAKDENKDQSYFLYNLNQKILKRCLFPLGEYTKDKVREIARKHKLKIQDQKESQEICFIQDKYYGDFLKKYLKLKAGDIIDENNNILGKHKGLPLYTIGQRRDIRIGGTGPYYVIGMNKRKNQLVVSRNKNNKKLFSKEVIIKKVNWISGNIPKLPLKIKAKARYRMSEQVAIIDKIKNKYIIKFSKPQRAIMPGQSVVFYRNEGVLGGGIIEKISL